MILWKLFAKNPFRLLKDHMSKAVECVDLAHHLFESLFANDAEKVKELSRHISQLEHECDIIKQDIRSHLTVSSFLPVDRRDIVQVLSDMDSIADYAEDIGVLLTLRWMSLPVELQKPFFEFLDRAVLVVHESAQVIDTLDRLLETGFSGPDADEVMKRVNEIERLEHLADKAQDVFAKALFAHEDELKAAELMMWFKIAGKIGDLANAAERMVGSIRLMLVSN